MKIKVIINKLIFKFSATEQPKKASKLNEFEKLTMEKKEKKQFFEKIQRRNFAQTPVFSLLISSVILLNFIIFITSITGFVLVDLNRNHFPLFFGANHTSSIIEGKQIWRIFSFLLVENSVGFNIIFTGLIIWITYWRIGYYHEIFLGSKKTAIVSFGGGLIIGISQFLLTKTEAVFFYGTEYLSLLSLGSLAFHYLVNVAKDDKSKGIIKKIMWQGILFIVLFDIVKYTTVYNQMENRALLEVASYYFIFPVLAFLTGFFLGILINYKKVISSGSIAVYLAIGFFVVLVLAWLIIGYSLFFKEEIGKGTWEKIEPFY